MQLYVAGHNNKVVDNLYIAWDLLGVFDSVEKAEAVCYDEDCFVGPIQLNYFTGQELDSWPGCWFPKDRKTSV